MVTGKLQYEYGPSIDIKTFGKERHIQLIKICFITEPR